MDFELIKVIQTELSKNGKINSPIVAKLGKYLKIQEEPYHEIQIIPNHLLPEPVLKILNENNVSLYKASKVGNHPKHLKNIDNEKNTYIFVIKKGKPNNILLTSNNYFSKY